MDAQQLDQSQSITDTRCLPPAINWAAEIQWVRHKMRYKWLREWVHRFGPTFAFMKEVIDRTGDPHDDSNTVWMPKLCKKKPRKLTRE